MGHYWPKLRIKSNHTLSFTTTPRTKDSNQKMRNCHRNPAFQVKTSDQFPSKETSDFINLKQLLSLICYFFFSRNGKGLTKNTCVVSFWKQLASHPWAVCEFRNPGCGYFPPEGAGGGRKHGAGFHHPMQGPHSYFTHTSPTAVCPSLINSTSGTQRASQVACW